MGPEKGVPLQTVPTTVIRHAFQLLPSSTARIVRNQLTASVFKNQYSVMIF